MTMEQAGELAMLMLKGARQIVMVIRARVCVCVCVAWSAWLCVRACCVSLIRVKYIIIITSIFLSSEKMCWWWLWRAATTPSPPPKSLTAIILLWCLSICNECVSVCVPLCPPCLCIGPLWTGIILPASSLCRSEWQNTRKNVIQHPFQFKLIIQTRQITVVRTRCRCCHRTEQRLYFIKWLCQVSIQCTSKLTTYLVSIAIRS